MNIQAIQNNKYNSQYSSNIKAVNLKQNPTFTASASEFIPRESKLLSPFKTGYAKLVNWMSDKYTDKIYTSGAAKKMSDFCAKHEKFDAVNIMQILTSAIISGMYVVRTTNNKDLEDDKKFVLALNQFFTFLVSTVLSLLIDKGLNSWWESLTVKYLEKQINKNKPEGERINILEEMDRIEKEEIAAKEKELGKKFENFTKSEKNEITPKTAINYIKNHHAENKAMIRKISGMGTLKKLIIFSTIYRYFSPVLVSPFANRLGNNLLEKNRQKKAQQAANSTEQ